MAQSPSQKNKSPYLRQVPTPLKLFFFPVLGLALIPVCFVLSLLPFNNTDFFPILALIVLVLFVFSAGMSFLLVVGGDFSIYIRFKRSSSRAEAEVIRTYSEEDRDVKRTFHYLELKFTITGPSGDAQEIKGILGVKERMYYTTSKGSKIEIQYATEDPYVISVESA